MSTSQDHALLALMSMHSGYADKVSADVVAEIYSCLKNHVFDSDQALAKNEVKRIVDAYVSASESGSS